MEPGEEPAGQVGLPLVAFEANAVAADGRQVRVAPVLMSKTPAPRDFALVKASVPALTLVVPA